MIGCAVGIASVLIYLLLGGLEFLQTAVTVHTYMVDLSGLTKGSPVRFNGIRVGEVTRTQLSHLPDPQKVVRVDMSIMQHFLPSIPEDSTVGVSADNLLGDKFADINEGKKPRPLQPDGELRQTPPPAINTADLITAARDIISKADSMLGDIEAGRGNLGQFFQGEQVYNSLLNKIRQFQVQIRAAAAKDSKAGKILYDDTLYEQLRTPVKQLNDTLAELDAGRGPGGKLLTDSAQYDQLRKSVGDLNKQLAELNAGKGATGKLLKDDELYVQFTRMIENLNAQVGALNAGEGAVGHLMVSSTLYESLNGSTKNLRDLLKELRANPQKFLRIKVF
jgi:phospholipid/cholesterol/gamma-HCH transport system substrate-binding protein